MCAIEDSKGDAKVLIFTGYANEYLTTTTLRHIKESLRQQGFPFYSKRELAKHYEHYEKLGDWKR